MEEIADNSQEEIRNCVGKRSGTMEKYLNLSIITNLSVIVIFTFIEMSEFDFLKLRILSF